MAIKQDQRTPAHPAPFPPEVIDLAWEALHDLYPKRKRNLHVLDPFAGVGGVHALRAFGPINGRSIQTTGVELMPRWARSSPWTIQGDATALPAEWSRRFDAVVTSPCYGNRMADHHNATDECKACGGTGEGPFDLLADTISQMYPPCPTCKGTKLSHRRSYAHYYGRDAFLADAPRESNAGAMAWGDEYRELHAKAWAEVHRVVRPGGRFVLNIKDHIKDSKRVRVGAWHRRTILELGFTELWRWDIPLDGYGFGANRAARVPTEQVYVFER